MIPIDTYIFKATAFCNLNCSYCYIFNLADKSPATRPKVMPIELVEIAAQRMVDQARQQNVRCLNIAFHGGEPLLAGTDWLRNTVDIFRKAGGDEIQFRFSLQSNGVLIDEDWIRLLAEFGIALSISLDGTPEIHDRT
ncbi:MAG: radical SAM protein, partial [Blastocatellia bacterium]